jgi:hypothetical protein
VKALREKNAGVRSQNSECRSQEEPVQEGYAVENTSSIKGWCFKKSFKPYLIHKG